LKKIFFYVGFVFVAFAIYYCFFETFEVSKSEALGVYVNRNYQNLCGPGFSDKPDTLTLLLNGKFSSNFYGPGNYTHDGSTIHLIYQYEYAEAGFDAEIVKTFFGKPRLILNYKANCYYIQISNDK